ncbi:MAG: 1-deoxy-D-xylulose-5-phosphate reductoisomerase [Gemmatimonadota bacterium]|nr:1-deoxy-D-xylulose-5-phosphate reductoisomerase [Gemmatimonadota bacterium]
MTGRPGNLVILGATGSIGDSALDVVAELGDRARIVGLACRSDWRALAELARRWRPAAVAISEEAAFREAREADAFPDGVELLRGPEGVVALASMEDADTVLNGIVGAAGLRPTLAALEAGHRVALANKESLVVGGELVMEAAGSRAGRPDGRWGDPGARLLPVDSEHAAVWQLLAGRKSGEIRRIVLTASGGPFRGASRERLEAVTPEAALAHPTWEMGPKITIDSATLANKGLEVIEAHHLFGLPYDAVDVVVHPQSIVHGLVEAVDGTLFAELGEPDMRRPIGVALAWPERVEGGGPAGMADLAALPGLAFEPPDTGAFPMLSLARAAGEAGGTAPAAFNAANEVAVEAFLEERIGFLEIASTVERVLEAHETSPADSVETLLAADGRARQRAAEFAGIGRTPAAPAG